MYDLIVAHDASMGIGKHNSIPWDNPTDRKLFREITCKICDEESKESERRYNAVIMGRHTWDSLPVTCRPLKHRLNIVLTRCDPNQQRSFDHPMVKKACSLEEAFQCVEKDSNVANTFVIGGAHVYKACLQTYPLECRKIYVSRFCEDYQCDVFLPDEFKHVIETKTHKTVTQMDGFSLEVCW